MNFFPHSIPYKCLICEDTIKPGWLKSEDDPHICDKRSCWEKFLPTDMVKKHLTFPDRYTILKRQHEIRSQ